MIEFIGHSIQGLETLTAFAAAKTLTRSIMETASPAIAHWPAPILH
jgi:hypothetical protein